MKKLLLIEDDNVIREQIRDFLAQEGFEIKAVSMLKEAFECLAEGKVFDLVISDWNLPDGQGLDFIKKLRQKNLNTPVIILTARTELIDKVTGLEVGANDYLTKPFEPRELLARMRVQLRSPSSAAAAVQEIELLQAGPIKMNLKTRETFLNEKLIELTKMEFNLLKLFIENPDAVFTRDELLNKVWGYDKFPSTRTVDTHLLQLRTKFGENCFETIRGVGYRFRVKK